MVCLEDEGLLTQHDEDMMMVIATMPNNNPNDHSWPMSQTNSDCSKTQERKQCPGSRLSMVMLAGCAGPGPFSGGVHHSGTRGWRAKL